MIYFFSGNSDYLLQQKIRNWKKLYIEKYGDINLTHIKNIKDVDMNFLQSNLFGASFFGGKKLLIIDNIPFSNANGESNTKNKMEEKEIEEYLLKNLEKLPEDNIVLFQSLKPDKRGKLYKKLIDIGNTEFFNVENEQQIQELLKKKYGDKISTLGIQNIIRYKSGNTTKIFSEIEKLLINYSYVDEKIIADNIIPELEESIFTLIDSLLNLKKEQVFSNLNIILDTTNIYQFYNNLLANLRTNYYISLLKMQGFNVAEIKDSLRLGNKAFLVTKNYKLPKASLIKLYTELVGLDKKMKSGKLIGTTEQDFKYELEKTILHYMK